MPINLRLVHRHIVLQTYGPFAKLNFLVFPINFLFSDFYQILTFIRLNLFHLSSAISSQPPPGEVNVAHDELAPLLRVAEALKVKGLVEDKKKDSNGGEDPGVISTSSSAIPPPPPTSSHDSPREVATSSNNDSPPHSTQHYQSKVPSYYYGKSPVSADKSPTSASRITLPMWGK